MEGIPVQGGHLYRDGGVPHPPYPQYLLFRHGPADPPQAQNPQLGKAKQNQDPAHDYGSPLYLLLLLCALQHQPGVLRPRPDSGSEGMLISGYRPDHVPSDAVHRGFQLLL